MSAFVHVLYVTEHDSVGWFVARVKSTQAWTFFASFKFGTVTPEYDNDDDEIKLENNKVWKALN